MTGRHRAGRAPRVTETSDFVAMLLRMTNALGDRIAADPIALVHVPDLQQALADAVNRGVFEANNAKGYSTYEIAALAGVTRQAVQQRVRRGEMAYAALQAARGAGPLVRLADLRRRRAELAAAAGVTDRTGSERERTLRAV